MFYFYDQAAGSIVGDMCFTYKKLSVMLRSGRLAPFNRENIRLMQIKTRNEQLQLF
jgi:hypothetical protein